MKAKASRSPDELLASYPPAVQALARKARRLILTALPGAEERADSSAPVMGYGWGMTRGPRPLASP